MNKVIKKKIRAVLPRAIRPHRIKDGLLKGRWIVTSWHDYPGAILGRTERPLLDWFSANVGPGQTWLDVGAHYGYTAIALSGLVGGTGRVFAFEPSLPTAASIVRTKALNALDQLQVIPMALGDRPELSIHTVATDRGMIDPTKGVTGTSESFLQTSLDWLWPMIRGDDARVDGLKIDIQGFEIHALKGMARLLREARPKLVVELHAGVDREEFFALIEGLGYDRSGVAVEPMPGETAPLYLDNKSYYFFPRSSDG